jgi:hypothetical protein
MNEFRKRGMVFFQTTQLMRLEQKERGLQPGKQGGTKDQNRNDNQQNGETRNRHSLMRER